MLNLLKRIVQEVGSAQNFGAALQILVKRVREAVQTQACSIFLFDEQRNQYVLMATEGLNQNMVGKLWLNHDEGLVAYVGNREEPINLEDAPSHPDYVFYKGLGEEQFKAFLGVPIIQRRQLYGVLMVQQEESRKFDESEEAFLATLSAHLAGIIAHAQLTGVVSQFTHFGVGFSHKADYLEGIPSSPGVAVGNAVVVYPPADLDAVPDKTITDIDAEIALFNKALEASRKQIQKMGERLAPNLSEQEQALFDVYLKILDSSGLGQEVITLIKQGQWAQGALKEVVNSHILQFASMEDSYLQERAADIKDLGMRVLAHLQESEPEEREYPEHTILIGDEVPASILAEIPEGRLVGVVSSGGSSNAHVAILTRALGVATVMGVQGLTLSNIRENQEIIVDGYYGQVYLNPTHELLSQFKSLAEEEKELDTSLQDLFGLPAVTPDGYHVSLFVNTGLAADASMSLTVGAEGVGLFRTEVPFMVRDSFPAEKEQSIIYRQLLNAFSPRPVIMRTLDVGGDKPLPYFPVEESNPYLGWRGIRITLDHPDIFLVQLRAMLKASVGFDNLRIMFPMISSVSELDEALEFVEQAYQEVRDEGLDIKRPPVGVMIEIPSAVYQAKSIARRVDFLSVGSNDLIQYLLAVDRNNPRVSRLYDELNSSVLYALQHVVDMAHSEGKQVSLCGEMASDPAIVMLLVAMGFDALSMSSILLPRIKWVIRSIPMSQAKDLLQQALVEENPAKTRYYLEQTLEEAGLGGLIRAGK